MSLSDNPLKEVDVAFAILKALGLRQRGVTVIACPTCGRTGIDVKGMARQVEKRLSHVREPVTVADYASQAVILEAVERSKLEY